MTFYAHNDNDRERSERLDDMETTIPNGHYIACSKSLLPQPSLPKQSALPCLLACIDWGTRQVRCQPLTLAVLQAPC